MKKMIDVIIPVGPRDEGVAKICALSVAKYVENVRTIYVVGVRNPGIAGTVYIDEGLLPFSLKEVGEILGTTQRAGWYFQQLVKLHAPLLIPNMLQQYLVVDADTFFLQKCKFVEDGRPVFNLGTEYHPPYFEHMHRMHPSLIKPMIYSGITHTLVYDRRWLNEMVSLIEEHHVGKPFWRIYLDEVDPVHKEGSGAAENELYFTFCIYAHIRELIIKAFKWSNISNVEQIDSQDVYVSLHWYLRNENLNLKELENRVLLVNQ
jgi:Family of unknown function (DUF6492)